MTIWALWVVIMYIIDYQNEFSWAGAAVLGSILATTDPVAVVALLKELGAPLHIETLIEMESLFNDGTAMVFYTIFLEIAKGNEVSAGEGVVMFIKLAIGGPLLGIAFGILAIIVSYFLKRGMTLFLNLILISCYITFFVAEKFNLGVSGILALVALGLTLNYFMKNYMTNS